MCVCVCVCVSARVRVHAFACVLWAGVRRHGLERRDVCAHDNRADSRDFYDTASVKLRALDADWKLAIRAHGNIK